jgi:hypothetical protein
MIAAIILLLIVLWFLGYIRVGGLVIPDYNLFSINGRNITLWNLFLFLVILWAIGVLPSPLREIAAVMLILWILSTVGVLAIAGLSNILVIALIVGLILSLFGKYY